MHRTRPFPGTFHATTTLSRVSALQSSCVSVTSLPHRPLSSLLLLLPLLLLPGFGVGAAHAQGTDTLRKIKETGTINLGHRESSVPFSYYDARHQVVGYSHDLMLKVLDAVKAELGLPALTIKLVPVTAQNRIPLVQNGAVDLECGSTSHTIERERQVGFSVSIFVVGTRLMTSRSSGIHDFTDLAGRKVVITAGTTSDRLLRTFNERTGDRFTIVSAKDHGESFRLLEMGQVDAFMLDDALLYGERAKALRPENWIVVGTPMSSEVYGCMLRREDTELKLIVDRALSRLMVSGEALRIHTKWFLRPITPKGLNLNWPPSDDLMELYRVPNDKPRG
jgi:glutamate/aspartate transport system substrate-binding protein